MMNLVIRSRVTPFSKSRWGVMSLRGPLVSYSHSNEDHRHQSSEWLKWSWLLSEGAPLCWFLLRSSVESPRSRHTPRECAHESERGVGARCVDNEQQTSNWHGQYWVKNHTEEGRHWTHIDGHTHTHTKSPMLNGLSDIWPGDPKACQHHILAWFCAWQCDHMFSSVWPTCTHV